MGSVGSVGREAEARVRRSAVIKARQELYRDERAAVPEDTGSDLCDRDIYRAHRACRAHRTDHHRRRRTSTASLPVSSRNGKRPNDSTKVLAHPSRGTVFVEFSIDAAPTLFSFPPYSLSLRRHSVSSGIPAVSRTSTYLPIRPASPCAVTDKSKLSPAEKNARRFPEQRKVGFLQRDL